MDPINGIASVLTLLQVAATLAKTARDLYNSIKDALAEFQSLARHLLSIQQTLAQLQAVSADRSNDVLAEGTRDTLQDRFLAATEDLKDIGKLLVRHRMPKKLALLAGVATDC